MTKIFTLSVKNWKSATFFIIAWFVLMNLLFMISPQLSEVTTNNQDDFLPSDSESVSAMKVRFEKFPSTDGVPAIIALRSYINPSTNQADVERTNLGILNFVDLLRSDIAPQSISSVISPIEDPSLSSDKISMIIVNISGSPQDENFGSTVDWITNETKNLENFDGISYFSEIAITGPAGIFNDAVKVFQSIDQQLLLLSITFVVFILFVIYKSPVLAIIPLLLIFTALGIANFLAALLAKTFELPLNGQVTGILSILVIGAGTNYVLFIVSRYKEELIHNSNKWEAMTKAMSKVGPSITGSAGTTIVAMSALTFASYGSFRALGPMLAMGMFIVLLCGIFIIPSVIVLFGKSAFWTPYPKIKNVFMKTISRKSNLGQSNTKTIAIWEKIGDYVVNNPKQVFLVTMIGIIIASVPSFSMKPSFSFVDGFPDDSESKIGYKMINEGFPGGQLSPTQIFIKTPTNNINDGLMDIEYLSAAISNSDEISKVYSATRPYGNPSYSLEGILEQGGGSRYISDDNSTTRLEAVIAEDYLSVDSLSFIKELRKIIKKTAENEFLTIKDYEIYVGGDTAVASDTKSSIDADILWLAPVSLIAILLILMILLKSIVAPLYLLFSVVVSFAATFGLSIFAFQVIFQHSGVAYATGVWMFIFLVALGADYNIFVMSRIRESTDLEGVKKGISKAISKTGGVVTSAGIILAGTFGIFTTLELRELFQLGFAVMLGVLIDTFIVRALLVPSMATLLGNKSWWPNNS
ncbi:MAG: MMPL family transporter [Dehalococcoidia bacterium]